MTNRVIVTSWECLTMNYNYIFNYDKKINNNYAVFIREVYKIKEIKYDKYE